MTKKLVAFVCAPYTAVDQFDRETNIVVARMMAANLWKRGWAVICPQSNSAHFSGVTEEDNFYEGYEEILRRCDAISVSVNWRESKGCRQEVALAKELGLHFIGGLPGKEDA